MTRGTPASIPRQRQAGNLLERVVVDVGPQAEGVQFGEAAPAVAEGVTLVLPPGGGGGRVVHDVGARLRVPTQRQPWGVLQHLLVVAAAISGRRRPTARVSVDDGQGMHDTRTRRCAAPGACGYIIGREKKGPDAVCEGWRLRGRAKATADGERLLPRVQATARDTPPRPHISQNVTMTFSEAAQ